MKGQLKIKQLIKKSNRHFRSMTKSTNTTAYSLEMDMALSKAHSTGKRIGEKSRKMTCGSI